ncbi:MAG TPA: tRNA pseudouridine(55) synthase TruB [Solirubrobacterales bacterium]|nr:tRNA pseudouridine(55) synthase TruB [Solirubrobacterales bacterium]
MSETGILVWDKPAGVTSHDVVAQVRRERGGKVGHAGTLDPFATGVLTILLGRATRLQKYLLGLSKTYVATARLGWTSTTGDRDGELTETGHAPTDLSLPTGRIRQMVPMTSAVRVDGERLYKKAHRGEEAERPVREVTIHRAELLESGEGRARYEIECSSGTYVRTLIETLGDAYCEELRRTAVGPIGIERAGELLTPLEALSFLPRHEISVDEAVTIGYGQTLDAPDHLHEGEPVLLVNGDNLTAVASRVREKLKAEVVLEPQG